jgi:hypothetical protein
MAIHWHGGGVNSLPLRMLLNDASLPLSRIRRIFWTAKDQKVGDCNDLLIEIRIIKEKPALGEGLVGRK